jgi:glycosyltransferase involved in cell wall biosynthesis
MERRSLSLYDQAIGVTPEIQEWILAGGRFEEGQVTSIGNGVDVGRFRPICKRDAKTQLGLDANTRYLVFVGSFKPWHDLGLLVQVLPTIVNCVEVQVQLLLVGDGPGLRGLELMAEQMGVSEMVSSLGNVAFDQIPILVCASDICLSPFPSGRNIESGVSPLKVFEYMACGRPLVTTRLGVAFDEWLEDCGCSLLVPPGDHRAFANAIIQLLSDPAIADAMGQRGRAVVVECCSWDRIVQETEQFILSHPRWSNRKP